ncbi:MAG: helix-turn-helix transcriptional regulator [Actinomycetota bacterium]
MGSGASSRAEIDDDDVTALADLGAAMRARRTQLGLTLSKLSDATGLSVPFLSQVETSFAAPSLI